MMPANTFAEILLAWHDEQGRHDLPWQQDITPYSVWLSEVMLQQTQVTTVIPYFEKFIKFFPNIQDLATADEDHVLHLWSGLGYYSRARNLHRCAKTIVTECHGKFPTTAEELSSLPGIGRSTAGAILSIALKQRAPILDGNVKRVLCRLHGVKGWSGNTAVSKQLWGIAESLTPTERVAQYTQAIMDFGATLCTRSKPQCHQCPFQQSCYAYQNNCVAELPQSKPKKVIPTKHIQFLILQNEAGEVLLEKRPPVGIWGSLWSFPECPSDITDISAWCKEQLGIEIAKCQRWPSFRHTFSHFHLEIQPIATLVTKTLSKAMEATDKHWYPPNQPSTLGLAAPVQRLLKSLQVKEGSLI